MGIRLAITFLLGIVLLTLPACAGRLYKVAPLPDSAPSGSSSESASGLSVGAFALDGDSALDRFQANLPLAGVLAVDVRLVNKSAGLFNSSGFKFELRDAAGKNLKPLSPKKALDRVMKFYGNSFYLLAARQRTREEYEAVALKTAEPIRSQDERRGILFFQTNRETRDLGRLTLSVHGAAAPISMQLAVR